MQPHLPLALERVYSAASLSLLMLRADLCGGESQTHTFSLTHNWYLRFQNALGELPFYLMRCFEIVLKRSLEIQAFR